MDTKSKWTEVENASKASSGYGSGAASSSTTSKYSIGIDFSLFAPVVGKSVVVGAKQMHKNQVDKPQNLNSAKLGRRMKAAGLVGCPYCVQWFAPGKLEQHKTHNCAKNKSYLAERKIMEKNFKPKISKVVKYEESATKIKATGKVFELGKGWEKRSFMRE